MDDFVDKNALEPLFTALADRCLNLREGVLAMITPTVALCATSAQNKRRVLAQRFHIHTVLTSHQPQNINMKPTYLYKREHRGDAPPPIGPQAPTRFINLDVMPVDDGEIADFTDAC